MDCFLRSHVLLFQLVACAVALVVFVLSPPAHGRMLLVSLDGNSAAALGVVLAAGGGLVGRGRLPQSLIVFGDYARLAPPLRAAGAILIAAPYDVCGEGGR